MKRSIIILFLALVLAPLASPVASAAAPVSARVMRQGLALESAEHKRLVAPTLGPASYGAGYVESSPGVYRCETRELGEDAKGVLLALSRYYLRGRNAVMGTDRGVPRRRFRMVAGARLGLSGQAD